MTALLLDGETITRLVQLRARAASRIVDVRTLAAKLSTPEGREERRARMTEQTIMVPVAFFVTFSIETGHPAGVCRHMSMSSAAPGRIPTPEAVAMVAPHLGFVGNIQASCVVWLEDLSDGGRAVNMVQPIAMMAEGTG